MSNQAATYSAIWAVIGRISGRDSFFTRGLSYNITDNSVDELLHNTRKLTAVSPTALVKSDIVSVSTQAGGVVDISGGWSSDRDVGVMLVKNTRNNNMYILNYFTDPNARACATSANLNPETTVTINSVAVFRRSTSRNLYLSESVDLALRSGNTLTVGTRSGQIVVPNRPKDILHCAAYSGDSDEPTLSILSMGGMGSLGKGVMGRSITASPAHNLSISLMGAGVGVNTAHQISSSTNPSSLTEDGLMGSFTSKVAEENNIEEIDLLDALYTGQGGSSRSQTITLGKLMKHIPNLVFTPVASVGHKKEASLSRWDTYDAKIGADIATTLPALMLKHSAISCGFAFTNESKDVDGFYDHRFRWGTQRTNNQGSDNGITFAKEIEIDKDAEINALEIAVRNILVPTVTRNRRITVQVSCDVHGDLEIQIESNGVLSSRVAPTFSLSAWGSCVSEEKEMTNGSKAIFKVGNALTDALISSTNDLSSFQLLSK